MPILPLEILVAVGLESPDSWLALLALPPFARWTQSSHALAVRKSFLVRVENAACVEYYFRGRLHNFDDEPAIIWTDARCFAIMRGKVTYMLDDDARRGGKAWFNHGLLTRENDLPAIIMNGRSKQWYKNNLLHRGDDRPAIVLDDDRGAFWYINDKRTRENDAPCMVSRAFEKIIWNSDNNFGILQIDSTEIVYENGPSDKISREYFNELLDYYSTSRK